MLPQRGQKGFTLIELLIVIAIIGILAAVLIPNLLNARERAFDTAAQTCLKEIATNEEMLASNEPWNYDDGTTWTKTGPDEDNGISSCENVMVASADDTEGVAGTDLGTYAYHGTHANGGNTYYIALGTGVTLDQGDTLAAHR